MATSGVHRGGTSASAESANPMGTRKTMIIMVTVVGCIAILWPKVFYPMMVGPNNGVAGGAGGQYKPNFVKDHRGSGCCDVVLDQEKFANASINAANQHDLFRKRNVGPAVEDGSIRQERPPHLRPETIHPAMRERGRAIPHVGSVHSERPQSAPRIVEGRPGPIPGMRPPMGAGSHQSTKSVNSMGFIMPLYTIGIVSFFIYTILKLLFKKNPATPYPEIKPDTTFREEVFTQDQYIKRPVESGKAKLGQPIGENGVPASAGPVSNGNATTSHGTTVQAEISVDYEQLAAKSERQAGATTDSADVPVQVQEQLIEEVLAELNNATVTAAAPGSEQPKETECNESVADEYEDILQPSYDPATEKVVDGIVVKRVVRFDEEGTTSSSEQKTLEQVASQMVEEVIQEAESAVTEEAEAAAVQMVEQVVQQAEAAVFGTEAEEKGDEVVQSYAAQEEVIVSDHATTAPDASETSNEQVEENSEADAEQSSEQVEKPIEDTVESTEEAAVQEQVEETHNVAPVEQPVLEETPAVEHESEVNTEEIAVKAMAEEAQAEQQEETAGVEQETEVSAEEVAIKAIAEETQAQETAAVEQETEEVAIKAEQAELQQEQEVQAEQPCEVEATPKVDQETEVTAEEVAIKAEQAQNETAAVEATDEQVEQQVEEVPTEEGSVQEVTPNEPEVDTEEEAIKAIAEQSLEDEAVVPDELQAKAFPVQEDNSEAQPLPETHAEEEAVKADIVLEQVQAVQVEVQQPSVSEDLPKEVQDTEVSTEEEAIKSTGEQVAEEVQAEQPSVPEEAPKEEPLPEVNAEEEAIKTLVEQAMEQAEISKEDAPKEEPLPEVNAEEDAIKTLAEQVSEQTEIPQEEVQAEQASIPEETAKEVEVPEVDAEEEAIKAIAEQATEQAEIPTEEAQTEQSSVPDEAPKEEQVTEVNAEEEAIKSIAEQATEQAEIPTEEAQTEQSYVPEEAPKEEQVPEVDAEEEAIKAEQSSEQVGVSQQEEVPQEGQVPEVTAEETAIMSQAKQFSEQPSAQEESPKEEKVPEVETEETVVKTEQSSEQAELPKEDAPVLDEQLTQESETKERTKRTVSFAVESSEPEVDAEESMLKALAAKMEEAVAQQAEEAEIIAIAEDLVSEVLEQAEEIANERLEEDSFELPSYDPATQKLVDGQVINRFDVVQEVGEGSASAEQEVVEEVAQSVVVKDVSEVSPVAEEVVDATPATETVKELAQEPVYEEVPQPVKVKAVDEPAPEKALEAAPETQAVNEVVQEPVVEEIAQPVEVKAVEEQMPVCSEEVNEAAPEAQEISEKVQEPCDIPAVVETTVEEVAQAVEVKKVSSVSEEVAQEAPAISEKAESNVLAEEPVQKEAEKPTEVQEATVEEATTEEVLETVTESTTVQEHIAVQESNESAQESPITQSVEVIQEAAPTQEESAVEPIVVSEIEQASEPATSTEAEANDEEPSLPEYDPETQKLVDGIVIERFQKVEASAETAEPTVEEAELPATTVAAADASGEVAKVETTIEVQEQKQADEPVEAIEDSAADVQVEAQSEESVPQDVKEEMKEAVAECAPAVASQEQVKSEEVQPVEDEVKSEQPEPEVHVQQTVEAVQVAETNEVCETAQVVEQELSLTANLDDVCKLVAEAQESNSKVVTEEVPKETEVVVEDKPVAEESQAVEVSEDEVAEQVAEQKLEATTEQSIVEAVCEPVVEEVAPVEESVKSEVAEEKLEATTEQSSVEPAIEEVAPVEESVKSETEQKLEATTEQVIGETAKADEKTSGEPFKEEPVESAAPVQVEEPETVSETLITTEVVNDSGSTEPVIYSGDETAAGLVESSDVESSKAESVGKEKVDVFPRGPTIEEVTDDVKDVLEGTASEEHVIKIDVEKRDTAGMISEVVDEPEEGSSKQEKPASPVTIEPALDVISEHQEEVEEVKAAEVKHGEQVGISKQDHYTAEKLEHARQEALVERTLTEATVVASEIESIVDHIITEKILQTTLPEVGGSQGSDVLSAAQETVSEPQSLATSAAKVVESIVIEEKVSSSVVTSTVPASSHEDEANSSINQLGTSSDTNQTEVLTIQPQSARPLEPSSSPSPAIELNSSTSNHQEQVDDTKSSVNSILDTKTEQTTTTQQSESSTTSSSSASSSSRSSTATVISTLEESSGPTPATTTTIIDQVPTSVSNVTNPKFLTLNLVNYSLSESSGNNSDSSASAPSAFKTLAAASPSSSVATAGTADVSAAVETAETSGQLMELDLLRRKLDETEQAMTKIIANMGCIPKGQETEESDNTEQPAEKATEPSTAEPNGHVVKHVDDSNVVAASKPEPEPEPEVSQAQEPQPTPEQEQQPAEPEVVPKVVKKREAGTKKKRQTSNTGSSSSATITTSTTTAASQQEEEQRGAGLSKSGSTVKVIPMEKKVAYEPGHHGGSISRPTSPVQSVTLDSSIVECDAAESKCVLLETKVPQSSKVLVANSDHSVEKLNTATATATSPAGTEGDTPFDLNLIVVFESVSNLNQGRSLELNVLLGSEPTTSTATVVNSSSSSSSASTATRVASPTREVVLSGKMKLSLVKLDDVEKKSTDDVVVKPKDDSKKSSRFGANEE